MAYSTVYHGYDLACWGLTNVHVKLSGDLYFDENCQAMLRINFNEKVDSIAIICSPGGGGMLPEAHNNYTLYFPVIDGARVSGPPLGPGPTGTGNRMLHIIP